jgi:hypothetical protein
MVPYNYTYRLKAWTSAAGRIRPGLLGHHFIIARPPPMMVNVIVIASVVPNVPAPEIVYKTL